MKATLRRLGGIMGGELAGHYYFRDMYHADSRSSRWSTILNLLWESGQQMSQLVAPLHRYAKSPEINFEVEDKEGHDARPRLALFERRDRPPRRRHRAVRRLVVQRAALEHRAAAAPRARSPHAEELEKRERS
jgi:phosphomannomutase